MAKLPEASPQLPPYLESILSDGHHGPRGAGDPYSVWTPPSPEWIDCHRSELERALDALRANLAPAPAGVVCELLARLAVLKGSPERGQTEWKLIANEYLRLLGHYPEDIWLSACDEIALSKKFFPDISETNALMAPKLRQRRQQIARLEQTLVSEGDDNRGSGTERQAIARGFTALSQLLKSGELGRLTKEECKDVLRKAKHGDIRSEARRLCS